MSDFDREAERERLREKYEADQEKRESTQRMSELLLRGATMTDSHCDTCGDPIFRYDGQEFCATCRAADGETAGNGEAEEAATTDETPGEPEPPAEPTTARAAERDAPSPPASETPEPRPVPGRGAESRPTRADDGDLAAARASLERTLARFARRAEETDSPRAAADHLAAAREAAEALAALDRR